MTRKDASPLLPAAVATAVLSLGAFLLGGGFADRSQRSAAAPPVATAPASDRLQLSPLAFEPAAERRGAFVARGQGYSIATAAAGWTIALRTSHPSELRARLVGPTRGSTGAGRGRLPGTVNYMV